VLYYCLTAQYPFPEGTAVEKMMAHQTKQPPPIKESNPETPDELVAIIDRLMQKTPNARYGSVAEAVEALKPLASDPPAPGNKYFPQPVVQVPSNGLAETSHAAATVTPARRTVEPTATRGEDRLPERQVTPSPVLPTPSASPPASSRPTTPSAPPVLPTRDRLLNPGISSGNAADSLPRMPSKYAVENLSEPPKSLDERLGTTGMVIMAAFLAVVAFFLFKLFTK
jgi:serine/threonine-protein kinase